MVESPIRTAILQTLERKPGLWLRELVDRLDAPYGHVQQHVNHMALYRVADGNRSLLFLQEPNHDDIVIARLRARPPVEQELLLELLRQGATSRRKLHSHLPKVPRETRRRAINDLLKLGWIHQEGQQLVPKLDLTVEYILERL